MIARHFHGRAVVNDMFGKLREIKWGETDHGFPVLPSKNSLLENSKCTSNARSSFGERVAMYSGVVRFGISVLALCLCCFCQKENGSKDSLVKIGGTTIAKKTYDAFQDARGMFPSGRPDYFSRSISDMTYFISVNILSEKGNASALAGQVKSGDDWKWKKMFYPAQAYLKDIVHTNLGFTEKDLEAYYAAHKEQFKKVIHPDTTVRDTLKKAAAKVVKKDSVFYTPLQEVRDKIVETLFLVKYPVPDTVYRKNPKDTARIDSAAVQSQWVGSIRRFSTDFFMKELFQEKYKKAYSDSVKEWYGDGKIITPKDMKVIISWLPEDQRGYYSTPNGTRDLAKWLLRWKLYSEKAAKTGFDSQEGVKALLDWAWKINIAYTYLDSVIMPSGKKEMGVDTAMCEYAYWDDHSNPLVKPDSFGLSTIIDYYRLQQAYINADRQIYELRKKKNITVLQNDYKDDMAGDPVKLIMHADSIRDTGNANEAESIYETLSKGFLFTPEGMRSLVELAKILTEKQQYSQAIKKYREYLIFSKDKSKRCNTFFMVGFIYDEYLNRPEDARINYRWVLKNTPECELTDDAEFMSLHLGEAMNSVEELRAEALRQGKKVDTSSIPEPPADSVKKLR
jgi:hypothetical protein